MALGILFFTVFNFAAYYSCREFDRRYPRFCTQALFEFRSDHERDQFKQQLSARIPNGFELRDIRKSELLGAQEVSWKTRVIEIVTRTGKLGLYRLTIISSDGQQASDTATEVMNDVFNESEDRSTREYLDEIKSVEEIINNPTNAPSVRENARLQLAALTCGCPLRKSPIKFWEKLTIKPHPSFGTFISYELVASAAMIGAFIVVGIVRRVA